MGEWKEVQLSWINKRRNNFSYYKMLFVFPKQILEVYLVNFMAKVVENK